MKKINYLQTKTAKTIKKFINNHVNEHSNFKIVYSRWYVGVTNNPTNRKNAHKNTNQKEPYFWVHFNCRSKNIALAIEQFYHDKGMLETDHQGGTANDTYYVYVYKKHKTILD